MTKRSPVILAIGNLNVDMMFGPTKSFPSWGAEIVLPNFEIRQGGQATNFAVSMVKLGCDCQLVASVGDDILGRFLIDQLRESKVDTSYITIEKGVNTAISVAIIRPDGERSFVTFLGHLERYGFEDIKNNIDHLKGAKVVHYGGYFMLPRLRGTPLIDIFKSVKESNVTISFDTGWDPEGWGPEVINELSRILRYVDVFMPNLEEAKAITGCRSPEEAAKELSSLGPKLIAIKMGSKGSFLMRGKEKILIPAFKVATIDTVGAGDIFDAGIIFGLLKGWSLKRSATFANGLSALFISREGKLADRCPTYKEVNEFLDKRKKYKSAHYIMG